VVLEGSEVTHLKDGQSDIVYTTKSAGTARRRRIALKKEIGRENEQRNTMRVEGKKGKETEKHCRPDTREEPKRRSNALRLAAKSGA